MSTSYQIQNNSTSESLEWLTNMINGSIVMNTDLTTIYNENTNEMDLNEIETNIGHTNSDIKIDAISETNSDLNEDKENQQINNQLIQPINEESQHLKQSLSKFDEFDKLVNEKPINELLYDPFIDQSNEQINQESALNTFYHPIESSSNRFLFQIENDPQNNSIEQTSHSTYQNLPDRSIQEHPQIYATIQNYSYQQYSSVYSIEQNSQNYAIEQYPQINTNIENYSDQQNVQIESTDTQFDAVHSHYYLVQLQTVPITYSFHSSNTQIMNKGVNQELTNDQYVECDEYDDSNSSNQFYTVPNDNYLENDQSSLNYGYDMNYIDSMNYRINDHLNLDHNSEMNYVDNMNNHYDMNYNSNMNSTVNIDNHMNEYAANQINQQNDLDEHNKNIISPHNVIHANSSTKTTESSKSKKRTLGENIFPFKLYNLINNSQTNAIRWTTNGDAFEIDFELFQNEYLTKKIFRSNKVKSFVRSLNLYGFSKLKKNQNLYYHANFRRGDKESLKQILRRK